MVQKSLQATETIWHGWVRVSGDRRGDAV